MSGNHLPMLISIPPKYAVSQVVGYINGKSVFHIARQHMGKLKIVTGQHFWARGYYVSTAGRDEEVIRQCNNKHENIDKKIEKLGLFGS